MTRIHSTAVIDSRAQIGEDVTIGPYCVVDGPVRIGRGSTLHAFVTLWAIRMSGRRTSSSPGA